MDKRRILTLAIVTATAALLALGFCFFPWTGDDITFRLPFREHFVEGAPADLGAMWEHFIHRHHTDNSRLSTLLMIAFGFLPDWFNSLLSGLALLATMWLMLALLKRSSSVAYAALVSAVIVFLMPWYEMYVFDLQMAYIWVSALGLWLAWLMLRGTASAVGLSAVALIVGLWQEAVGLPVFAGLMAVTVLYRRYRTVRNCVALLFMFIGLVWLYLSPGGRMYRADCEVTVGRLLILIPYLIPSLVLLLLSLWRALRRHTLPQPALLFCIVGSVVSALLGGVYGVGLRLLWWSSLTAYLGLMMILSDVYVCRLRAVKYSLTVLLLIGTYAHLAAVDHQCLRQKHIYDYVTSRYMDSPGDTIYVSYDTRGDLPLICLQKPYGDIFTHSYPVSLLSEFYGGQGAPPIKVVHESLRNFRPESAESLPGSAGQLFYYKGFVVGYATEDNPEVEWLSVDYGAGPKWRPYMRQSFRGADGMEYTVFTPEHTFSLALIFNSKPRSASK